MKFGDCGGKLRLNEATLKGVQYPAAQKACNQYQWSDMAKMGLH